METIIITVTDERRTFFCDLEVPVELEFGRLKEDMVQTLNAYKPELYLKASRVQLFCNRTEHLLAADETLEKAGVWNGDFITIMEG